MRKLDRAAGRVSPALVLLAGFALAAIGLLWLALTAPGQSYLVDLLPGVALSGFGHGLIYTSMFTIGTRDVPPSRQGSAGALLSTSQYLSGAVTVAILTLVPGAAPAQPQFRTAFLVTGAAALAGVLLAVAILRRPAAEATFSLLRRDQQGLLSRLGLTRYVVHSVVPRRSDRAGRARIDIDT